VAINPFPQFWISPHGAAARCALRHALPHVVCVRNLFVEYSTGSSTSDTLEITLF
jgi:hypothetical protein